MLSTPRPSVRDELTIHASERIGRAEADRFRDLGDPEYGLFLDDVAPPAASSSAA